MTLRRAGLAATSWLAGVLLSFPAAAAAPASSGPADQPAASFGETVEVNVVNVDVFVTDRAGQAVPGLRKGDFQLFEDGKPVAVENFTELARAAEKPAAEGRPASAPPAQGAPASLPAQPPSYIAIYVDNANLRPGHRDRVLRQLRAFLANNVSPDDRVMVASYDLGLNIETPFTSDRGVLARALDAVEKRPPLGGEVDRARETAVRTMLDIQTINGKLDEKQEAQNRRGSQDDSSGASQPSNLCGNDVKAPIESFAQTVRQEALRTVGNLTMLVNSLSGVPGRKTLLYVTDGLPVTPGEELYEAFNQMCGGGAAHSGVDMGDVPTVDMTGNGEQVYRAPISILDAQKNSIAKNLDALTAHANANRVSFYTLQATGAAALAASSAASGLDEGLMRLPSIGTTMTLNYQNSLSLLAANTGGKAIFDANDVRADLGRVWSDLSTYYSLGFTPAHKADGHDHRIEVKVKRSGLRVRHLQSYRDKPLVERTVDRTLAALLYGVEENPLEVQLEAGDPVAGAKGLYTVPLHLRIPLFKLGILNQEENFVGSVRLFVATQGGRGALSPVRQVAVPIKIPRAEVLRAMGQFFAYNLTLELGPGEQRVAVAVRDELAATSSYLSRNVSVGGPPAVAGAVPASDH
jgi:VWFA-related protein